MPVVLIGNHKGGVGKTTVTVALAAEMAMQGRTVVAVDLDPQANLTRRFGYKKADLEGRPNVSSALENRDPDEFRRCLVPCQWDMDWADRLFIAPGHVTLERRATEAGVTGAWRRLRGLLAVIDPGALVLIDTPPSMGHLVQMGLTAADHVLVVSHAEYDSVMGAYYLRDFLDDANSRADLDLHCTLGGVIVNNLRKVGVHSFRTAELRDKFADLLWEPFIPQRAAVAESQEASLPPQDGDPRMRAAFKEIGARVNAMVGW